MDSERLEIVERLKNLMMAHACEGNESDREYRPLRSQILADDDLRERVPSFVRTCSNLLQFRRSVQARLRHYSERREFVEAEFAEVIAYLMGRATSPGDDGIQDTLATVDRDAISREWKKALERRSDDPEAAITSARTLLETVIKHILDARRVEYDEKLELPKLYKLLRDELDLSPGRTEEKIFQQVLGGCTSIVEGLGAVRNRFGDAHGKGIDHARAESRHAELAVNLAGAVATFLLATWKSE